ncbi:Crp/Fnr family transcriptional regulator [Anaerobutyricum hallii]|uniref:Crp/Fnr family transcriptional regulator n=2 Tax=Anaerobutyricum hallii TaxID=39488 RepID=A0A415G5K7_9FIRM|nr:Crp/Fnr family transcriptional regulator [Anaerobutyricum hallii]
MFVKEIAVMNFDNYFPVWNELNTAQKKLISDNLITQHVKKGTVIHNGNLDCTGLLLVKTGQLRTYILSDEGREITLYRLFDMDICLLSASCIIRSIQFEVTIEAEKDTDLWIIPSEIYKVLMKESAPVANYTNELMATRFSDVMWLIEQIMWKSLDKRVASFLLEETSIEETNELKITHETIANHLGSHREVITRMLRYFQGEGLVKLSRGKITILDLKKLETLQRS